MDCGTEIRVRDAFGNHAARFIAMCGDRFMLITYGPDPRNGFVLPDWRAALRELIALAVPAALIEKTRYAESAGAGRYVGFPLTYPLSASGLAQLLDTDPDDVRDQLADLAVPTDQK